MMSLSRSQFPWRVRLRYRFDNALSRGIWVLAAWLAVATLGFVVLGAGLASALRLGIDNGKPTGFAESWWQVLTRVLSPGGIRSDVGWRLRILTLCLMLAGIFVATSLIGLVATSLNQKVMQLRKGRGPVLEEGHTLVLGWSRRLATVVSEVALANENHPNQAIVILANRDKTEMEDEIRAQVTDLHGSRIVCRTGDVESPVDLALVSSGKARSVIVLAGEEDGDAGVVKSILALLSSDLVSPTAPLVAEVLDERTARSLAAVTNRRILTVQADDVIAKVTAQSCYQAGLSHVYRDLLDFAGDEIYLAPAPELVGHTFGEALLAFPTSSVIGRRAADGSVALNPPVDTMFGPGDQVIAITADDDTLTFEGFRDVELPIDNSGVDVSFPNLRVLLVGWSSLGPRILKELDPFVKASSRVDVVVDEAIISRSDLNDPGCTNLTVRFHPTEDELSGPESLIRDGEDFDLAVVLGYRDKLTPSQADARSLLTLLTLRHLIPAKASTRVVCEILDSRDVVLAQASGADDFVVSDELASLMIAQLSERGPELQAVFEDLFDREGATITLQPATYFTNGGQVSFSSVVAAARARGMVALGYRLVEGKVVLNPSKSATVDLSPEDRVILLTGS
jgi:voltage-gated potassium channel Kch